MTKTTILHEQLDLEEAQFDAESRVLKNVRLIKAGLSLNNRLYSETVLQASVAAFEGTKAYDGHERGARKVAQTTGWYSNVRFENGALRADRHFTRTQAGQDVLAVVEDIVSGRAPATLAGLSINAVGQAKPRKMDGKDVLEIESITAANSVDDVDNPAAGGTYLSASTDGDALTASLIQAMTYEEFIEARPDYLERLRKEQKAVRQDEAVKAAQTVSDRLTGELEEAQTAISTLEAERDAAVAETHTARRDLAIEQALAAAKLPADWHADLRKQLEKTDPTQWKQLFETERRKASVAGYKPKVAVTGADQQVSTTVLETHKPDPLTEARRAIANASSPEELRRIQEQLRS